MKKVFEIFVVGLLTAVVALGVANYIVTVKQHNTPVKVVAIDHQTTVQASSIIAKGKVVDVTLVTEEEVLFNFKGNAAEVLGQIDQFVLEATMGKDVAQYTSQVYSFVNCRTYTFIDTDSGVRYLTGATDSRYNLPKGSPLRNIKDSIVTCIGEEITPIVGLNWEELPQHPPTSVVNKTNINQ